MKDIWEKTLTPFLLHKYIKMCSKFVGVDTTLHCVLHMPTKRERKQKMIIKGFVCMRVAWMLFIRDPVGQHLGLCCCILVIGCKLNATISKLAIFFFMMKFVRLVELAVFFFDRASFTSKDKPTFCL